MTENIRPPAQTSKIEYISLLIKASSLLIKLDITAKTPKKQSISINLLIFLSNFKLLLYKNYTFILISKIHIQNTLLQN